MNLWQLAIKEIRYKKLAFSLGILAVIVAVGVLVAEMTLLNAHDLNTQEILISKENQMKDEMVLMEDDYRKIMKVLGFNLLVLPEKQTLSDFYLDGYSAKDMPEEYVNRLAASKMVTIRHLLPSLEQKINWPEKGMRPVILIGIRGEVPITKLDLQEPILEAVPPGCMVLGYELWKSNDIKIGDKVKLLGKDFQVSECHSQRGTKDDITIWIDLKQAQELMGKKGRINAIMALKCICFGSEIENVRKDINTILPNTEVIEFASNVITREQARSRAEEITKFVLASEKSNRADLRREMEEFASLLVPLIILGCTVWIGLLAYGNVRERKTEIGILRALGLRSKQILSVFMAKSLLLGLFGALLGYIAGFAFGVTWGEVTFNFKNAVMLFNPYSLVLIMITAPVLTCIASWIPAVIAAKQDPAIILRNE